MALRLSAYLIEGELDNTHLGTVSGWMQFAGMKEKVTFDLKGDFHRDIRGTKIHLRGDASEADPPADAQSEMEGIAVHQSGNVGDITAGLPPADYVDYPYVEWYSDQNGRVVLELQPAQIEVIGTPIPACESDPVSRDQQRQNMAEFLGDLATEMNLPQEQAVCISGSTVIQADKRAANDKIRGMKLLTKETRQKLPPLYAQDKLDNSTTVDGNQTNADVGGDLNGGLDAHNTHIDDSFNEDNSMHDVDNTTGSHNEMNSHNDGVEHHRLQGGDIMPGM